MRAFIRSITQKTWKSIIIRWEAPKKALEDGVTLVKKAGIEWNPTEDEATLSNSKALNAIYNGLDRNVFWLINTCESAKKLGTFLKLPSKGRTR